VLGEGFTAYMFKADYWEKIESPLYFKSRSPLSHDEVLVEFELAKFNLFLGLLDPLTLLSFDFTGRLLRRTMFEKSCCR
jgi:hypothetical protein